MPWTADEINVIPKTQRMSLASFPGQKWHKRTEIIINKASKNIGIISKIRHLLPENLTRTLYLTLVDPYMSYCNIVWSAPNNTDQLDKILKLQKKYCRLITFSDFRAHSKPLFQRLSILSVYNKYNTSYYSIFIKLNIASFKINIHLAYLRKIHPYTLTILIIKTIVIIALLFYICAKCNKLQLGSGALSSCAASC